MADAITGSAMGSGGGASGGATSNGGDGFSSSANVPSRTRPAAPQRPPLTLDEGKFLSDVKPATEQPEPAKPATQQAAERAAVAYRNFDIAFGDLPKRFLRSARTLADQHNCRMYWDAVEATHDDLREFETR